MKEDLHQEILNAQQREALRLREEEHLTYPQIAARMGLSEGRIQQVLSVARARVRDCSEHGEGALCLVPLRVRHFLKNYDIEGRKALREAIDSGRLAWDIPGKRLRLDGRNTRNVGWKIWQVICE
ncbi:MAG: hypothetical protein JNJ70_18740 [Verrucomicrobiales bacterium]|nr:hypothetical protein [Verrucomicrobiales bacterium]